MNVQQSRQLKAGDRVCQARNARDIGVVLENSAANVLIDWKDGTRTLTAHAGMGHVTRVAERRLAVTLLKLAPVFALVLGLGFYLLKEAQRDATAGATPAPQRVQTFVVTGDPAPAPKVTDEQWAALKQPEGTK